MADLPPPPQYHLLLVSLPWPPLITMAELNERVPQLASAVYPTTPREETSSEPLRHNITKLLLARWSQVDPSKYALISGKATNYSQRQLHINQVKKWAENIQSNWIGTDSWFQRYIAGAICWSDFQKLVNNLHRTVKLLSIVPNGETPVTRTQRKDRGREYKKALRVHREHIHLGAQQQIADAKQAYKTFLEQYREGIQPTNMGAIQRVEEAEAEEKYYVQLSSSERLMFLEGLWNEDTFVSFLWEFRGVLHLRKVHLVHVSIKH
jgi:hypothetical protein